MWKIGSKGQSSDSEKEAPQPVPLVQIMPQELEERLREGHSLVLLDVREPWEFQRARIEGSVLIPLRDLPRQIDTLNKDAEIVVMCHHGVRSLHAIQFLSKYGFMKLKNLWGGIDAWSKFVDPKIPRYE
jgi:rhodanese-related sulfurtransferase